MFGLTLKELKITDSARDYLEKQISDNAAGIRLSILTGKGCSGNEYDIRLITESDVSDKDDALDVDGRFTMYIPKADSLRFFGTEIDYETDSLGNKRIMIKNPNETSRCGCGESIGF